MKNLLVLALLAGVGYLVYKLASSGSLPTGHLNRIASLPGMAVSRIGFSGGNLPLLIMIVGAVLLVLLVAFLVMSK
jgi:hypothetical protein